ncbi:hypothetical protein G4V62_02815 [Bacillaceae bacterium SIJ1]|uniref:hypothetical protein n=1 Tax=Litoribacterium kuwaitense TaxID=1398745 RepID=UPI0013EA27BE|nr:hypothetical protein [Litoribacterium kuwaitense]NGP43932.1 hypothetical protein [Litoribacterium kuwaitense]
MTSHSQGKRTMQQCSQHLDMLHVDNKVKQIVYMYMETLYRDAYAEGQTDAQDEAKNDPVSK